MVGRLCSAMGVSHGTTSAWLRNLVRPGLRLNGPSDMRLAGEKARLGAAQGWAGENGDRRGTAMHPSQVAGGDHPPSCGGKRASLETLLDGSYKRAIGDHPALVPKKERASELGGIAYRKAHRIGTEFVVRSWKFSLHNLR